MKLIFYITSGTAILCGLLFPVAGKYTGAIPYMIALMLFFNFLDLKIDHRRIFRKEMAVTFLFSFVVMPLITYYGLSFGIEAPYRIGLLLVACAPAGIMGIILIRYVKSSDASLAFNNLLFTTFGAILCVPVLLKLFVGRTIIIEIRPIIVQTTLLVILPFLAARAVNLLLTEKLLQGIRKSSGFALPLLVFFTVMIAIGSTSDELIWDLGLVHVTLSTLGIYLLHAGLGFWAGNLIGGKELRNTMTFISSSRNCNFALAIAILNFPALVTIPIVIASIFHHTMNAFWLWVLRE